MWQAARTYVVYGVVVVGGLGMGYASIDYAVNGPKASNVNSKAHWASGKGNLGVSHSWVIDSGKQRQR